MWPTETAFFLHYWLQYWSLAGPSPETRSQTPKQLMALLAPLAPGGLHCSLALEHKSWGAVAAPGSRLQSSTASWRKATRKGILLHKSLQSICSLSKGHTPVSYNSYFISKQERRTLLKSLAQGHTQLVLKPGWELGFPDVQSLPTPLNTVFITC